MLPYPRRLPHVVTRADLALLVAPTYAAALSVDDEEAQERLARALERPEVAELLYGALAAGLAEAQGPKTTEDALLDKLSRGVQARRARARAAPDHPGVSAVLVRINLEIGLAPESMRATLETDKGRAVLGAGLAVLGKHLVKELLR